jgi:acetyl esterase/lipase
MMDSKQRVLEMPPPPADRRIVYGPDPNHLIDVRFPPGKGPWPGILALHGGFWRAKYDLTYFGHVCAALAADGFVTCNVEYRRVGQPGGGWPGTFHDVAAAAAYVLANAEELGLQPDRLTVIGHSAGGHLALWLAGRHRVDRSSEIAGPSPAFRAAVCLGGAADLHHVDALRLGEDAVREFLSGGVDELPERFAAASPASLVPLDIPQLIVHGEEDPNVPVDNVDRYVSIARAAGDDVREMLLPGIGHFEIVDPDNAIWPEVVAGIRAMSDG